MRGFASCPSTHVALSLLRVRAETLIRTATKIPRGCWESSVCPNASGHGALFLRGTPLLAHRVVWVGRNGPIPKGKLVLHKCDNPICVRPSHLYLGNQKNNVRDAIQRGRWKWGGVSLVFSYDSAKDIRLCYASGWWTQSTLARAMGCSQSLVHGVIHNKRWRVLTD